MVAGRIGEAHELLQRCADQGWLFPESLAQFVDGHAGQNLALDMHLTFCAWVFPNLDSGDVAIAGLRLVLAGGVYRPIRITGQNEASQARNRGSTALPVWPANSLVWTIPICISGPRPLKV